MAETGLINGGQSCPSSPAKNISTGTKIPTNKIEPITIISAPQRAFARSKAHRVMSAAPPEPKFLRSRLYPITAALGEAARLLSCSCSYHASTSIAARPLGKVDCPSHFASRQPRPTIHTSSVARRRHHYLASEINKLVKQPTLFIGRAPGVL